MQVPSLLSTQWISALDGPSMAKSRPPDTNTAAGLETHAEAARAGCVCTVHTLRRIFSVDGEHGGLIGGPVDQTPGRTPSR